VDYVYQLACFHGNQSSIARPFDDLENGLKTTLVTLEWVKTFNPQARVIYSGAGCAVAEKTWDEPTAVEEHESTSLLHDSPYSISKITGEMYCLYYAKQQNLDVVRVRFQNVYGPREILGAGAWRGTVDSIWRNVIPTFIWKSLNNEDITIFGTKSSSRDFVYVEDIANGVILAAKFGKQGRVYNLARGEEIFISDLAKQIITVTNSKSSLIYQPKRTWDTSGRRFGSTKKSFDELNFLARTNLISGLNSTVKWYQDNNKLILTSISNQSLNLKKSLS
jgi:UDP-glucose 4-epimerase